MQLAGVVVNRVLPELFGRQEEAVFDALDRPRRRWPSSTPSSTATPDRCSTPPAWPSPCAGPARPTSSGCARGIDPTSRCSTCPYLFTRSHGLRTTRQVAESLGEELGY